MLIERKWELRAAQISFNDNSNNSRSVQLEKQKEHQRSPNSKCIQTERTNKVKSEEIKKKANKQNCSFRKAK